MTGTITIPRAPAAEIVLPNGNGALPAAIPEAAPALTPMEMLGRAVANGADIAVLERLMELQERWQAQQAQRSFSQSMRAAQEEMRPVVRDADNPSTHSKYASYVALDSAVRPIYTKHGFGLTFDTGEGALELHVRVICDCLHEAGHIRRYHLDIPADGKGARGGDVMTRTHATVSAVSYGRRGLLKMIFNIADGAKEDDDGNAAGAGNGAVVSDKQAAEILRLVTASKSNIDRFLKWAGAPSIPDIPAARYDTVVKALQTKMRGRA